MQCKTAWKVSKNSGGLTAKLPFTLGHFKKNPCGLFTKSQTLTVKHSSNLGAIVEQF